MRLDSDRNDLSWKEDRKEKKKEDRVDEKYMGIFGLREQNKVSIEIWNFDDQAL